MVAEPHRDDRDPAGPGFDDAGLFERSDDALSEPAADEVRAVDADAAQAELDAAAEREEQLTRLFTATVMGTNDERIGKVGQVYLDDQTQEPNWITVRTGLFGTKEYFIPLDEAQLDGKHILVPYSKADVTAAPATEIDQNLSPDEEDALYNHYRVPGRMTGDQAASLEPTAEERAHLDGAPAAAGVAAQPDAPAAAEQARGVDAPLAEHGTGWGDGARSWGDEPRSWDDGPQGDHAQHEHVAPAAGGHDAPQADRYRDEAFRDGSFGTEPAHGGQAGATAHSWSADAPSTNDAPVSDATVARPEWETPRDESPTWQQSSAPAAPAWGASGDQQSGAWGEQQRDQQPGGWGEQQRGDQRDPQHDDESFGIDALLNPDGARDERADGTGDDFSAFRRPQ